MIDARTNSLKIRRTKIIATLGPASSEPNQIESLINVGVNIFRQNFSHGEHSYHKETYSKIRETAKELNKTVGVLADLCGPKIRTGKFKNDKVVFKNNQPIVVTTRDVIGTSDLVNKELKNADLPDEIKIGAVLREKEVIIPRSNYVFKKNDIVVFLAKKDQIPLVENIFRISAV